VKERRAGSTAGPWRESYPAACLWRGVPRRKVSTPPRGPPGTLIDSCAYPHLGTIKHENPTAPSQPAPYQQVQQSGHHHDSEHHEGCKQDERHRASNTTLLGT
jgi:hypothetical protein